MAKHTHIEREREKERDSLVQNFDAVAAFMIRTERETFLCAQKRYMTRHKHTYIILLNVYCGATHTHNITQTIIIHGYIYVMHIGWTNKHQHRLRYDQSGTNRKKKKKEGKKYDFLLKNVKTVRE